MPNLFNTDPNQLRFDHFRAFVGTSAHKVETKSVAARAVDSPLLTVKEAQVLMKRGRARMYEMIARHELKHIRDGKSILIPRECVTEWIENKKRQSRSCR